MTRTLRVAIVGAGPAGIYAGNILRTEAEQRGMAVAIDLFEALPAPYGLIRYGVAPDHPRIKGIVDSLHEMLDEGTIRLFGNVTIGTDITIDELRARYHAVIVATGASRDTRMNLPGIDLPGSFGAADFVSWYDGHPDHARDWPLDASIVAVLGNGNVALDVARILAKHPHELLHTDIPDTVLDRISTSPVTDVHVFGRRGPAQIKFTPIELRELGEMDDVDVILDEDDFDLAAADPEWLAPTNNQLKIMQRILNAWRSDPPTARTATRRLHLHFWHEPAEILGDTAVEAIRFRRTRPTGYGSVAHAGESIDYPVQAVYRAIGYYGSPLPGLPFDADDGVIPNTAGRVTGDDARPLRQLYVTGWIKRGPVGLIGHTKSDAHETIAMLLDDAAALPDPNPSHEAGIEALLESRGVEYVDWNGWLALDAHERALGASHPAPVARERVKVVPRDEQVLISRARTLTL
jgi:ferredoxin--NADP+ reductase